MDRFDFLKKYNTVDLPYVERSDISTEAIPVKTYINGQLKEEGRSLEGLGTGTEEEAINKTLDFLKTVEQSYKNIWVRKMPEVQYYQDSEDKIKYFCRVRLAFCN